MRDVVHVPDFLLPNGRVDMAKWAVIACDQFTSEPAYWQSVSETVGDAPSTLRLIYPEATFLEAALLSNENDCVPTIHQAMRSYLSGDVFGKPRTGYMLVERTTHAGKRLGLLLLIDLQAYGNDVGDMVRPTEGTVWERVPPRVHIRENAPLELPHVMLLANDPQHTLVEPLYARKHTFELVYDFDLMLGGGHVRGFFIDGKHDREAIEQSIAGLPSLWEEDPFLFAVGDGNHSLAAAKQCYIENPTEQNRYTLVEVVNLYQDALQFAPIHRLIHGVEAGALEAAAAAQGIALENGDVRKVQPFLDAWLPKDATIDYIHGDDTLKTLSMQKGYVGVSLQGIKKEALFPSLAGGYVLPRKAFSMGEATEKRYYVECRRIGT